MDTFVQIWYKNFSGKMSILSFITNFLLTFSGVLVNLLESFFRKVPRTAILGQNGHFSTFGLAQFGQNVIFFKKKGAAIFSPLLSPNFMPSFRKILGAVSEINCVTDARTHDRTDEGDIIEPVASLVQYSI